MVTGAAAHALMGNFEALRGGDSVPHVAARPAVRLAVPQGLDAPRLPQGLLLMEIDAGSLLLGPGPREQTASPMASPRSAETVGDARGRGCMSSALAQVLVQLHVWGLDVAADTALLALLDEQGLARLDELPGSPRHDPPGAGPGTLPWHSTLGLGQAAAAGAGGAITLQLPSRVAAAGVPPHAHAAAHSGRDRVVSGLPNGGAHCEAEARRAQSGAPAAQAGGPSPVPEPGPPAWQYGLLRGDGALVAARLLGALGAAKALMGRAPATEARCTGCAAAAALYAVGLRGALPALASPRLGAFMACWQARGLHAIHPGAPQALSSCGQGQMSFSAPADTAWWEGCWRPVGQADGDGLHASELQEHD